MSSQLDKFAHSLIARAKGEPAEHYPGAFTDMIAAEIAEVAPEWSYNTDDPAAIEQWGIWGAHRTLARQVNDLDVFGVEFDRWSFESSYHSGDASLMRALHATGLLWREGKGGIAICGNCATVLPEIEGEPGKRGHCPLCVSGLSLPPSPELGASLYISIMRGETGGETGDDGYRSWRGRVDDGVHPANDFVAEAE